ncbi:PREDICTED: LOW QUALITY PROTEIN: uncharacterized protein LOC108778234 [Cyphomyrmex costatus]|uniref:LOW QUALITY PROTEIN: uncharacterized protein LOC108778234 n=1 Tax=Cyphomyrmex costatus TaxID=456900 RepID=UPI0008522AD9|nr:PREDICTED: LOW QUALITY PROTEIN: uncharacterized protein LOC108778234 [Cyphomyrmex costatus]
MTTIPHDLQMSYLRAIQKIPGDTANEKLCWIGRLALYQSSSDLEQFPPELLPILNVETAIKKKKHEDITFALKCEDSAIINRAFKAFWFFDGSHKEIVNVRYFFEHLFPYVSVNTRTRIVLTLAHQLSGKDPIFAQEIFTEMVSIYGIQIAYPLIIACNETFTYEIIVQKELVLPINIVKKIFYINPDLVVRFLKLLKPRELNATERNTTPFAIGIDRYKSFLPKLIKKRLEAFIELFEIHETSPPNIILSNKCAEIFLKKAQQHLIQKPQLYIRILPLKKINKDLMEKVFPGLLPTTISDFSTDNMLSYLKHYPRDKQYDLLSKSYKDKYNVDLLDETNNVTPALLQLLPVEERIKQAKIKILEEQNLEENRCQYLFYMENAWICYLPVNEVIPVIKEKLNKTTEKMDRIDLLLQMIYACNVNKDNDALFDFLKYFLDRHKNEDRLVFTKIFDQLSEIYNLPYLNEKLISLILDIVQLCYVKHKFMPVMILVAIIHFKLIHNMPIEELIDMLLESNRRYEFNILTEYPRYERQCLVTFANQIKKKSFKEIYEKKYFFSKLFAAIYDFNNWYKKSCTKIEKMTIRDYPWLMDVIYEILRSGKNSILKNILQENEPELYCSWFPSNIPNACVTSGVAHALLKRDLPNILDNWEEYLANCMKDYNLKHVQRFIKATQWYKDLPIKFFERCMNYIYDKNTDEISSSLVVLALLCHGDELTKLIDPFIPIETTIDINHPNAKNNYEIIKYLLLSMRLSNPPIPLDLIVRLCVGDYLSIGLYTLTSVSRRTSLPKVISIAQKLMSMDVTTRKHGIGLMYMITTMHELTDFLQKTWAIEKDHSVRQILFETFQICFLSDPNPETWSLYCQTVSTLSLDDEALVSEMKLFSKIPSEYVVRYLDLWLKTINDFQGLDDQKKNKYVAKFLATFTESIFNLLSEEFTENILRRF